MTQELEPELIYPLVAKNALPLDGAFDKSLQLCAVWEEMLSTGCAMRENLDPLIFGPTILPYLVIINVLDDGTDFQWRLFGGAHIDEYGTNLTGVRLSDLKKLNSGVDEVETIFTKCVQTKEPVFYSIHYMNSNNVDRSCDGVMLPLFGEDGRTVTHLIGCSDWG